MGTTMMNDNTYAMKGKRIKMKLRMRTKKDVLNDVCPVEKSLSSPSLMVDSELDPVSLSDTISRPFVNLPVEVSRFLIFTRRDEFSFFNLKISFFRTEFS